MTEQEKKAQEKLAAIAAEQAIVKEFRRFCVDTKDAAHHKIAELFKDYQKYVINTVRYKDIENERRVKKPKFIVVVPNEEDLDALFVQCEEITTEANEAMKAKKKELKANASVMPLSYKLKKIETASPVVTLATTKAHNVFHKNGSEVIKWLEAQYKQFGHCGYEICLNMFAQGVFSKEIQYSIDKFSGNAYRLTYLPKGEEYTKQINVGDILGICGIYKANITERPERYKQRSDKNTYLYECEHFGLRISKKSTFYKKDEEK